MLIQVKLKPNSRQEAKVEKLPDGTYVVVVREPAIEGRANKAARELLAEYFSVAKSRIFLKRGETSKLKFFEIDLT